MSQPKTPKSKMRFKLVIESLPLKGYILYANIGVFGLYRRIAAVTTRQEVNATVSDLINLHLR